MIDLALFLQLAASCAPHVAPETLAAVARTESNFTELAIHDNATRRSFAPASRDEAIALATDAISVQRHSVDLGLMQINSANLPRLGMSVADAFDPCRSLAAADRVLVAGYALPANQDGQQEALRQALSRYNTGNPVRGVANGYVARVQAAAEVVVPAIRLRAEPNEEARPKPPIAAPEPPSAPPSWDVYRQARANGAGGTLVFGSSRGSSQPATGPSATSATNPTEPRAAPTQQALNDTR